MLGGGLGDPLLKNCMNIPATRAQAGVSAGLSELRSMIDTFGVREFSSDVFVRSVVKVVGD